MMNASLSKREINRQRWRERIDAWQESGQSQKAFCQQQRLGLVSFQRWWRIFKTEGESDNPAPVTFLPVSVRATKPSNLTVVFNDTLRIESKRLANYIYPGPIVIVMMPSPFIDISRAHYDFELIQKSGQSPALV